MTEYNIVEITLLNKCDDRYLSGLFPYEIINNDDALMHPSLMRHGGDKYSPNPYLNKLLFEIVASDVENVYVKEFVGNFNPNIPIQRDAEITYRIPISELNKSVLFCRKISE